MNKSLTLALFLGAVKSNQVFETPLDESPTEAEAFTVGFNEAMQDLDADELDEEMPFAEEGLMFDYVENSLEIEDDMTELYGDQSCWGGIKRWYNPANSLATYNRVVGGGPWNDPLFGADSSSLYWGRMGVSRGFGASAGRVVGWKRPRDINRGQGMTMFGQLAKAAPTGINQGQVGDCWFLAALAAVAEEPIRIHSKIHNAGRYPNSGAFRFYFWAKNNWIGVNIDDRLPVIKWGNGFHTWATSRSKAGAWWTPLYEKAYAKFNQNYDRITGGSGYEGLKALTGMPVQRYQFAKTPIAQAWQRFSTYSNRNFPMTTPCCRQANPHGLVSGHAYTFLGTVKLSNGVSLAHVRNPWGAERYKGPWSDHDSKWNANFLKQAGHTHGNDGSFFMPFNYYYQYFYELNVAYYERYANYRKLDYKMAQKRFAFKLNNPVTQEFYIVVETLSPRNFPRACPYNTFLNTYLRNQRGQQMGKTGFVGNGLFHDTRGYHGIAFPAGQYDFQIYNWNWDNKKQVAEYTVSVFAKKQALGIQKYA